MGTHTTDLGIIGREHPSAVVRADIARLVDSHGGLLLVTGEAGIGKTTLVSDAAEHARRLGVLVLSGSCWDSASAPGFWPWVQVIRALRRAVRRPSGPRSRPPAGRAWPPCSARAWSRPARRPRARRSGRRAANRRTSRARRVPAGRRGHLGPGRGLPDPAGAGGPRRSALGRPGLAAAARVRRAAHLVRAAAAGRHLPRRRGGRGRRPGAGRCSPRWWPRRPR